MALAIPAGLLPLSEAPDLPSDPEGEDAGDGPPGEAGEGDGESVDFETVWRSAYVSFGYEEPTYLVIQTEAEWEALWARANQPRVEPPEVDFATRTVLVALLGTKPTGGYSIDIEGVLPRQDDRYTVSVEIGVPGPTCGVTMALTYPVHMVSIPRDDGPFHFDAGTAIHECK